MTDRKYELDSVLDIQHGGSHYKDRGIQPIEYAQANSLDWKQFNVVKYTTRHKDKNGAEDLKKAIHYLQMALEFDYGIRTKVEFDNGVSIGVVIAKDYAPDEVEKPWYPDDSGEWVEYNYHTDDTPDNYDRVEILVMSERAKKEYMHQIGTARLYSWGDCGSDTIIAYKIVE